MKKKIAVFVDAFYPYIDGCVNVVINYYEKLQENYDVTIFVPKYKKADYSKFSFKVFCIKSINFLTKNYPIPLVWHDKKLIKHFKENEYDLVHIHSPFEIGKFGINYAKNTKIYSIFTLHSQYKKDFELIFKSKFVAKFLTKKLIKRISYVNEIWNVNKNMENLLINDYDTKQILKKKKIKFDVISNATDFKMLDDHIKKSYIDEINNKYKIDKNLFVMSYLGRVTNQKNILKSLDVAYELKNINKNFLFFIVGNGNYLNRIKKLIKQKKLESNVIIVGNLNSRIEILKIICRTNMSLFLSTYDANSLTKYEFASQKVPSMFIYNAITNSSIVDNVNGYLVSDDPRKIATRIDGIIKTKSFIETGKKAYEQIYNNWDNIIKSVNEKYNEILEKGR